MDPSDHVYEVVQSTTPHPKSTSFCNLGWHGPALTLKIILTAYLEVAEIINENNICKSKFQTPLQHHSNLQQSNTMPKSKRAKVLHLTKVEKKGKELTLKLFSNVRKCLDEYQYCFVFSVENMRNTYLKDVRSELADSRCVQSIRQRREFRLK